MKGSENLEGDTVPIPGGWAKYNVHQKQELL